MALEQSLKAEQDKVTRLRIQRDQLFRNIEALRAKESELEQVKDLTQADLDRLGSRAQTVSDDLNIGKEELAGLKNDIDSGKKVLTVLQTQIKESVERELALRVDVNSLADLKRRLTSDIEVNEVKLEALDTQRGQLDKKIVGARVEKARLQTNADRLDSDVAELKARRNALLQQIAALQRQIETKPIPTNPATGPTTDPAGSIEEKKTGTE